MARILLAEDDNSMRQFLTLALEKAGHEAVQATDGVHALQILEQDQDFDLLLTDIVMPGIVMGLSYRRWQQAPALT